MQEVVEHARPVDLEHGGRQALAQAVRAERAERDAPRSRGAPASVSDAGSRRRRTRPAPDAAAPGCRATGPSARIFLCRLVRSMPSSFAVREMFQPFSSSLRRMYSRSMWSRNSRSGSARASGGSSRRGSSLRRRRSPRAGARRLGDDLLGQVADADALLRQDHQPLDHVAQLAHVAGPRVRRRASPPPRRRSPSPSCRSRGRPARRTTAHSSGTSSARSRSGGARSGTTASRK